MKQSLGNAWNSIWPLGTADVTNLAVRSQSGCESLEVEDCGWCCTCLVGMSSECQS